MTNEEKEKLTEFMSRLDSLRDLASIYCSNGYWNKDTYMHGAANGILTALSIMEGKEPELLDAPEKWLSEN